MLDKWRISVTVERGGETNPYGDVIGTTEHVVDGMLFDPGTSTNDPDRMDLSEDAAKLFSEDPAANFDDGDKVYFTVYGVDYSYHVAGKPLRYPKGCVVNLGD